MRRTTILAAALIASSQAHAFDVELGAINNSMTLEEMQKAVAPGRANCGGDDSIPDHCRVVISTPTEEIVANADRQGRTIAMERSIAVSSALTDGEVFKRVREKYGFIGEVIYDEKNSSMRIGCVGTEGECYLKAQIHFGGYMYPRGTLRVLSISFTDLDLIAEWRTKVKLPL